MKSNPATPIQKKEYHIECETEALFNVYGDDIEIVETHNRPGEGVPLHAYPLGTVTRKVRRTNRREQYQYFININWKGERRVSNSYHWWLWETQNQQDRPVDTSKLIWYSETPEDITTYELIERKELWERKKERKKQEQKS